MLTYLDPTNSLVVVYPYLRLPRDATPEETAAVILDTSRPNLAGNVTITLCCASEGSRGSA